MFGWAWCLKDTCDTMEAATKAPSIQVSGLLISVIRTVTVRLVDSVLGTSCLFKSQQVDECEQQLQE